MKITHIAAIGACLLSLAPLTANAGSFKQLKTKDDFLATVADKTLTAEWGTMVIHSNGKVSGKVGKKKMVGAWDWQGKYWCRNVRIGNQEEKGTDCQKLSVDGDKMQFVRNKGKGDGGVLIMSN